VNNSVTVAEGSHEALRIAALQQAQLALLACNHCVTTDHPDLPRSEWAVWTIDHDKEIALIDSALASYVPVQAGYLSRMKSLK